MQTIKLNIEVENDVYDELKNASININHKIKEFLYSLVDDGYPAISYEEAKKRVSDAVNRYKNGTGLYLNEDEYNKYKNKLIQKYANN